MKKALFITFEGIEGCGKSTQTELLYRKLKNKNIPVIKTSEPGGTRIGKNIREILLNPANKTMVPLAELFLYQADRAQHVQEVIRPSLEKDIWVLCDRFSDSTLAYQGYARGIDLDMLMVVNNWATGGLKPDITFLLDCPVAVGLQRAKKRNSIFSKDQEARFENEEMGFHDAVRRGFLDIAKKESDRFRVIDAHLDQDAIAKIILEEHVEPYLP